MAHIFTGVSASSLEQLASMDQVHVKQEVEMMEIVTGYETRNRYKVFGSTGEILYQAIEEASGCWNQQCYGACRAFELGLFEPLPPSEVGRRMQETGPEVIHLSRPGPRDPCCFMGLCFPASCLHRLEVASPPGSLLGTVEQQWTFCGFYPTFLVKNQVGDSVLKIAGPMCEGACACGQDVNFKVMTLDDQEIGAITKKWTGFVKEAFTDADTFSISFPRDLEVNMKATLLGALFLIDFMFFEDNSASN